MTSQPSPSSQPTLPSVFDLAFLTADVPKTELWLVRHGEQDIVDRTLASIGEIVDPPLSARGIRQAELVGERMSALPIDAVYTSALLRARATAAAIAVRHDLEPTVIEDLAEIKLYVGMDQDKTPLEVYGTALMMGTRDRFLRERRWDAYPDSERSHDFRGRVVRAIDGIVSIHPGQRVVVACHGGVINTYLAHHVGVAADMWFRPAHTAVHLVYALDHVRSLRSINDHAHLPDDLVTH